MRTLEEKEKIKNYVITSSKTWYNGSKRQWCCAVTMGLDINELAFTKEMAIERMINRISGSEFLFSFIKNKK